MNIITCILFVLLQGHFQFSVFFSPGSLMVTFDLVSKGFNDSTVLFNTLDSALRRGVISPFTVSPVGFKFRHLQGKAIKKLNRKQVKGYLY